jgi:hypothetical protein
VAEVHRRFLPGQEGKDQYRDAFLISGRLPT